MGSIERHPGDASAAVKSQTVPDDREAAGHPAAAPPASTLSPLPIRPDEVAPDLRTIKRLLWVLAIATVMALMYVGAAVLVPIMAALLLSFLFKPLIRRLEGWGVIPPVSALLVMAVVFVVIFGGAASGADAMRSWMDGLPQATQELEYKFRDIRNHFRRVSEATSKISEIADDEAEDSPTASARGESPRPKPVPVEIKGSAWPTIVMSRTASLAASLCIMLVTCFFILASGDLLLRQLVQSLPALRHKRGAVEAWRDVESHVSAYLVTVTLINAGMGLAVGLVLWMLGLPSAVWWGVAAALGNYIPFIGPLLVGAGVFLASVLAFDALGHAAGVTLAFVAITAVEGYFITPMVLGRRLSLNPLVLFVWLVVWGWMWGVAGALMAVPMLVCLKIVCDHVASLHGMADVLSGYVRRAGESRGGDDADEGAPAAT